MPKLPERYVGCHRHYYQWRLHWHGGGVHDGVLPSDGNWENHDDQQASSLAEGNFCDKQFKNLNINNKKNITAGLFLYTPPHTPAITLMATVMKNHSASSSCK